MAFDFKAALKKPWVKYALIAIGVIGAYYIYQNISGGSSSSSSSDGMSDAEVQAEAALENTQLQTSAAASSQASAQQFQTAQQQEADATAITEQQNSIAGQLSLNSNNNQTSVSLANVQLQGLQAQLNEALGIQTIQAQEQEHISDNQTAVSLNQTNQSASVSKNQSNNGVKSTVIGGIIGGIASLF